MVTKLRELVGEASQAAASSPVSSNIAADVAAEGGLMITVRRMAVPAVARVTRPAQGRAASEQPPSFRQLLQPPPWGFRPLAASRSEIRF